MKVARIALGMILFPLCIWAQIPSNLSPHEELDNRNRIMSDDGSNKSPCNGVIGILSSGLLGAILAVLLELLCKMIKDKKNKFDMIRALIAECRFNISIMDEIASGVANGGSFKRVRDDVFVEMRKTLYQFGFDDDIYFMMAKVACDEKLLNNQLDLLQHLHFQQQQNESHKDIPQSILLPTLARLSTFDLDLRNFHRIMQ